MSGFNQSSCNIALNGTVLTATCKRADGETDVESTLDLNSFIGNDDGQLVPRHGGNFGASCTNIQLANGTILTCTATKIDGSKVNAEREYILFRDVEHSGTSSAPGINNH